MTKAQTNLKGFRDTGCYSARNSSKGSLIDEARRIFEALNNGMDVIDVRNAVYRGSLFGQSARTTRRRIWESLHVRYILDKPEWVIKELQKVSLKGSQNRDFKSLLYIHYVLRDSLTYDFVTEIIWQKWRNNNLSISKKDVIFLLDKASESQSQINRWADVTRQTLATKILSSLRDFGLLEGIQEKTAVLHNLPGK